MRRLIVGLGHSLPALNRITVLHECHIWGIGGDHERLDLDFDRNFHGTRINSSVYTEDCLCYWVPGPPWDSKLGDHEHHSER